MDADSAKCMKSMNISSMGENYASITCLPLSVREAIIIGLSHFQKIFLGGGLEMELSTILIIEG